MTIYPSSIRAKLTLTAVAVMGVLFVVLGGVVEVFGRQQIMSGVDAELSKRASETIQIHKELQRNRPPPGQGGPDDHMGPGGPDGPGGPGGPNGSHDPGRDPRFGPRQGNDRGGPHGGRPGRGPEPGDFQRAVQRIGDPLLSIGPRFVMITSGPPLAPPEMMIPYDSLVLKKAQRTGVVFSMAMMGNEKVRLITKLAVDSDGRKWLVQYPYPLRDIDQAISQLNQTLLILLPFGLGLTAMACLFLMKRIMRPIREITTTAESISAEDLSGRLNVVGADEFGLLAGTMNRMLGRIESAFEAQRLALERLEAILKQQRRFTADASHELKTPLAVIKANTGLMLHSFKLEPDVKSSVSAIDSAASRMNKLVQGLMVLARAESGQPTRSPEIFDLNLAIQNAMDQVHRPHSKQIAFETDCDEVSVNGCEGDIERVFVNLIDNACRHTREDGRIRVTVHRSGNEAVASVEDDGDGIEAEHLEHVFDRFYRVDSSRSSDLGGTGLGLAICKGIIESHRGTISIASEFGQGTTVTLTLPVEPVPTGSVPSIP